MGVAGKARHRTVSRGGRTWSYTPKTTTDMEAAVRAAFRAICAEQPHDGPVSLKVEAMMEMPASWGPKKKMKMRGRCAMKKPDADNILKLIGDSLNTVAWRDDSQVSSSHITKRHGDESKSVVTITFHSVDAER